MTLERTIHFHVLSFEGPDPYARAGGIASRITGLTRALVDRNYETHLWFVGDPALPPVEEVDGLTLHRWCQWLSLHHPGGVYAGEEGKRSDFAASLPPFLLQRHLLPHLERGGARAVILAEEWHTADAVLHLDWLLRCRGLRGRVAIFWNANNTFGFDRIDWPRLARAAVVTTVSRYMRRQMWKVGVDAVVIPNGLLADALRLPDRDAVAELRRRAAGRLLLGKVARWDPDKRWLFAIDAVGELKRRGRRPLLIARGGVEAHGWEVLGRARGAGLRVKEILLRQGDAGDFIEGIGEIGGADVVNVRSPLSAGACRLLYRAADMILANSGHEPFGLVGLEAMAVGGLACAGSTGEDYVVPGWNALVLPRSDAGELVRQLDRLHGDVNEQRAMRRRAVMTARRYLWPQIVARRLLPCLDQPG